MQYKVPNSLKIVEVTHVCVLVHVLTLEVGKVVVLGSAL